MVNYLIVNYLTNVFPFLLYNKFICEIKINRKYYLYVYYIYDTDNYIEITSPTNVYTQNLINLNVMKIN